jgi:hypothetical protein
MLHILVLYNQRLMALQSQVLEHLFHHLKPLLLCGLILDREGQAQVVDRLLHPVAETCCIPHLFRHLLRVVLERVSGLDMAHPLLTTCGEIVG